MKPEFHTQLAAALAAGLTRALGEPVPASAVRLPARHAAASCAVLSRACHAQALAAQLTDARETLFPPVCGVQPVACVQAENGWLLFTLRDEFYTAAVRCVQAALPRAADDCGCHVLNRMRALARFGGTDCPSEPRIQRALLLTLLAPDSPARFRAAQRALLTLSHDRPPRERQALLLRCGGVGDAAARLLYRLLTSEKG